MPRAKKPKLTIKRQKFVEALIGPANGNKTKAAEMAGYAIPEKEGSRLTKFADVAQAIDKRLSRVTKAMDSDEILTGLTQIARGKRPSKITVEDGEMFGKDGEAVPVRKTKTEYDRKSGYESMAKIRGLMEQKDNGTQPFMGALTAVPKPVLLELARALLAVDEQGRAIETRATVIQ